MPAVKKIDFQGKSLTIAEWAENLGLQVDFIND